MTEQVISIGLEGMKGHPVIVEANVRDDKDACVIIGLPDGAMKESKERILSCLHELEVDVTMKKINIGCLVLAQFTTIHENAWYGG